MLREDKRAGFVVEGAWLWKRWRFAAGGGHSAHAWRQSQYESLMRLQREEPVPVMDAPQRRYWLYLDRCFSEDSGLDAADVAALVYERDERRRRKLERARSAYAGRDTVAPRREVIPRVLRYAVFERDGGRCVECGSAFDLQYDHLIPVALGGATATENLQLLCGDCNRRKGASLG